MSMLAEPRRKQKWTLNPRGKDWSDDSSKFGQRMLEKMGWTAGRGLGINEQGMTEHVRVSFKNDTAGVGFKMEDLDKAWTEYQEGFNELLKELRKSQDYSLDDAVEVKTEPSDVKSLEQKSKQSRARVHYQKFTRGKDVNRYSSKDLANIFGRKELDVNGTAKPDVVEEAYRNDAVGTQDDRSGVVTINGGSMTDYFQKMGGNLYGSTENNQRDGTDESDCEITYAGFGFSSTQKETPMEMDKSKESACFENPCLKLDVSEEAVNMCDDIKVSKRKKNMCVVNSEQINPNIPDRDINTDTKNGFVNVALNLEDAKQEVCNGKEFEVSRAEFGISNCALDVTDETKGSKRVTFNDHVEYSDDSSKKKKGKAKLDKFEVENKKQKRKRKHKEAIQETSEAVGFVNEALDVQEVPEEVNDNEINERKIKKAKKRKGSRRSNLETIPEALEEEKEHPEEQAPVAEDQEINDEASETVSKKEKKKKKKKKSKDNVEDTEIQVSVEEAKETNQEEPVCEMPEEISEQTSKERKKSKKRKKDKQKHLKDTESIEINQENGPSEIQDGDQIEEPPIERQDKFRISLKKKKKKVKETQNPPIEEKPAEHEEDTPEPSKEVTEESSTKKDKKKKKKKRKETDTETSNEPKEEVSDKENTKIEDEEPPPKKSKKNKEHKKKSTIETNVLDTSEVEATVSNDSRSYDTKNSENTPKKSEDSNELVKCKSSPWNETAKKSKKLLKSLFHRNAMPNFPGSNVHEIKGYGVDV